MNPPDQPTLAPTPRTDAEQWETVDEVRCFARTLERELTETERLRFGADADRRRLRAEVERWKTVAAQMTAEREHNANEASRLRTEVDRLNDIINRASVQFFHDGTDGETAAKMLTVLNEAKP
jgi:translation initiation factor 2B subunit (eIF-2B alpha/beta/delta family)